MAKILLSVLLIFYFNMLSSQMLTPEQVVQKNLDFYNARNIDGFMSLFADDIKFYNFSDGKVTITGLDECRQIYKELFDLSPDLHSKIIQRIVFDNKVIDHEYITGRKGSKDVVELVLIYEVKNDLIYKVTVMRK
jgi:hypothetical protein